MKNMKPKKKSAHPKRILRLPNLDRARLAVFDHARFSTLMLARYRSESNEMEGQVSQVTPFPFIP